MRWLTALVAITVLALFAPPGFAQLPAQVDDYVKTQKKGIDAITAKKFDDGIAAFNHCLELVPDDGTSAYNLACVHSLKSEADPAFEWLGKAVDWGFAAQSSDEVASLETKDKDLESVRKDPRFAPLVERLKARRKAVADFVAKPEIYVPEKLKDAPLVPLLVVLHDAGQTKATALEKGPWKRLADELGIALVVPSAPCLVGSDPAAGMRWFDHWFDYAGQPWVYEKNISVAVDLFKKSRKVDPAQLFIVGEGQGGMVAFNVAIGAPGTYKGVVVCGSTILGNQATAARAKTAANAGLNVRLLVPDTLIYSPNVDPKQVDAEFTAVEKRFKEWEMICGVVRFQRKSDEQDQVAELLEGALKHLLPDVAAPDAKDDKGEQDGKGGG
jgi:predicted esterase